MPRNADDTRVQLVRAAERLFAERGVEAVSLREINREADQRNATALQYHFGDREGLVRAIMRRHDPAVDISRNKLLDEIEKDGEADLHRFAAALVLPSAEKLSDRDGGRAYLRIAAQLVNSYRHNIDSIDKISAAESPRRKDDRLFASHLIDLVTAILGAPISPETRGLLKERGER